VSLCPKVLTLKEVERLYIEHALRVFNGNKTQAARALGISIRSIRNKVIDYKLDFWKVDHPNKKILKSMKPMKKYMGGGSE